MSDTEFSKHSQSQSHSSSDSEDDSSSSSSSASNSEDYDSENEVSDAKSEGSSSGSSSGSLSSSKKSPYSASQRVKKSVVELLMNNSFSSEALGESENEESSESSSDSDAEESEDEIEKSGDEQGEKDEEQEAKLKKKQEKEKQKHKQALVSLKNRQKKACTKIGIKNELEFLNVMVPVIPKKQIQPEEVTLEHIRNFTPAISGLIKKAESSKLRESLLKNKPKKGDDDGVGKPKRATTTSLAHTQMDHIDSVREIVHNNVWEYSNKIWKYSKLPSTPENFDKIKKFNTEHVNKMVIMTFQTMNLISHVSNRISGIVGSMDAAFRSKILRRCKSEEDWTRWKKFIAECKIPKKSSGVKKRKSNKEHVWRPNSRNLPAEILNWKP